MVYTTVRFLGKNLVVSTKQLREDYASTKVSFANAVLKGAKWAKVGDYCPVTFRQNGYFSS